MKSTLQTIFCLLLICTFSNTEANAQYTLDTKDFKAMNFRNIGPAGMSGRITAIDVDLSDKERIFAGSASGGLWLSENGGINWDPIFDDQDVLSIGAVAVDQSNPSTIWVGTGEGNPRNSLNTGAGIFKSMNGGKTWKLMGLENTKVIHRIIVHRDNPDVVYVAAMGTPWGHSTDRGVYRTDDGGKTWTKILYTNDTTGPGDLIVNPSNPNHIIAGMWQHLRRPYDFYSGGEGSGIHVSYDKGDTWKKIGTEEGMPKGELGRIGLAFAPSKPNIVYALIEAKENGLYKSTDGGDKWNLVSKKDIGNRPFYYSDLWVDPMNENRIYNLWSYVSRSQDGGKTFKTIMDYGNNVHPDHHAFWIDPNDSNYLINGNDGGLNISRDGGASWMFAANIPVGQFYHVNIDMDYPYNVYGGMQDNGSWIGPSSVLKRGGIRNNDFQELSFGDGFDVVPFRADSRYGYSQSQGGNVAFYDRETGESRTVKPVEGLDDPYRFNWNAAIAQDPYDDCGVYFGSQYVHYSADCGVSWAKISDDLTTNDTTKQHQDKSGGLTIDATQAENYTTIVTIAPSPVDDKVIWAGTDDGNIQVTRDGGETWTNTIKNIHTAPINSWINQIEVSSQNAGEAFVALNNYRQNDYEAHAYHTTDYGMTWRRIANDSQIKSFVQCIVQDPVEPNLLFIGADSGLYISFNKGQSWTQWKEGFPAVQVSDLKIHPREYDLVIGTFGRSFWILDDIRPLRAMATEGINTLNSDMKLFPMPDAYQNNYRSYDGIRFIAQGEFVGENKQGGAMMSIWKKPTKKKDVMVDKNKKKDKKKNKEDKKDKKEDYKEANKKKSKSSNKATFYVLNSKMDTVRTFTRKLKDGMNRTFWRFEKDGIEGPSRRKRKKDADKPRGLDVMPGIYKIIVELGDSKDSSMVSVKPDPRSKITDVDRKAINEESEEFYKIITATKESFDQLKDAKKSLDLSRKIIEMQEDTLQKDLKKQMKEISNSLDSLSNLFMDPEGLKGIQRNPNTLNNRLWTARRYLGSSWTIPGQNAMKAVTNAREEAEETIKAVNEFIQVDYLLFQETINGLRVKIFKEMQPVKIE